MSSIRFLISKIGYSIIVLWGVVTLVFLLFNALPADPARLTMGQRTDLASIANARHELNLDKPVFTRYLFYLNDLSPVSLYHSNSKNGIPEWTSFNTKSYSLVIKPPYLGRSYRTRRGVNEMLGEALPGTFLLAITAMLFATIIGIGLGILAAIKKNTWIDTSALTASVAGISMPSFFAGLLIAYLFGFLLHNYTGLDMTGSLSEYDLSGGKHLALRNLVLPAFALGIRPLAIITQLMRRSLLDVLSQDFIRTAYAKGLSLPKVIWHHALPNALNPVITAISGWLAELMAGSFFVEYIFGWKGVGKLTVDALDKFDFPLVMGSVLLAAFLYVAINLINDLIYAWLDPRVRLH